MVVILLDIIRGRVILPDSRDYTRLPLVFSDLVNRLIEVLELQRCDRQGSDKTSQER